MCRLKILFCLLVVTGSQAQKLSSTSHELIVPAERKPAPAFTLRNERGQPVSLSTYRGRVLLLDFWATWCGGCKTEIPWYMEFDRKYRRRGLAVVGIAMDDEGAKVVSPFVKQRRIKYTIVIGNEAVGKQFDLGAMPLTLLIDREGRIALSHAGVVDRKNFETAIQKLLK